MGWWGFGITDGDTPQDIIGDLKQAIGINDDPDEGETDFAHDRELIRNCDWLAIGTKSDEHYTSSYDPAGMVWQCLAWLYLEFQLDVPAELKIKAIEATVNMSTEDANDFSEPDERRAELNAFIKALEANKRDGLHASGIFWTGELAPRELFD